MQDSVEADKRAYAEVPYESVAYPYTHPARMAATAHLLGMRPAPPGACRVLEIGCGAGWNLIAMAARLPGSTFVGVDSAPGRIAEGERARRALGLDNLELRAADIRAPDAAPGTFDYVVAHGVYSWVPEDVRAHLWALCRERLAADGIAFVSYNTYPGFRGRQAIREMMLHHTRGAADPEERLAGARELVRFLAEAAPPTEGAYQLRLRQEAEVLDTNLACYPYHEHLATENRAFFFHELASQALANGLQYLGPANFAEGFGRMLPEALCGRLGEMARGDRIAFEQYQDFVLGRAFRRTLLCRREVALEREPVGARVADLHVLSSAQRAGPWDPVAGESRWRVLGEEMAVTEPAHEHLLDMLSAAWPCSVPAAELADEIGFAGGGRAGSGRGDEGEQRASFFEELLDLFGAGAIELVAHPIDAGRADRAPQVTALARLQLAEGKEHLTTAHHHSVKVDPHLRVLAALADGSRDRDGLLVALEAAAARGELVLPGAPPESGGDWWWKGRAPAALLPVRPAARRTELEAALRRGLADLEHLGLLS